MSQLDGYHARGSVPRPTARYGTLLEAIQLAQYQTRAVPCHSRPLRDRRAYCLAQAEAQPARLEAIGIDAARRSYIKAGGVPWEILESWVRAGLGQEIAPAAKNAPDRRRAQRRGVA